jgi:nitroimidazol reductase NimA-like FMN-containing flavoprotein (pyridoxamine 5'-phosphate oxidase superfamily)
MTHELRRNDLEITDAAHIERILSTAKYATIALADREQPYIVTLSCGFDAAGNRLCFHVAAAGRKLDLIAANPRAAATVIVDNGYLAGECAHPYESVVLSGRMRVLEDAEDIRSAMRTLIGQLESAEAGETLWAKHKLDTPEGLVRFRILAFEIDEMSAKSGQ